MKAKTTLEFIAELKKKTGLESDYAISKLLGVTRNALSLYRTGKGFMGDEVALKVAEVLELEDGYVLACIAAERSKNERVKKAWEYLGGFAAALAVIAILPIVPMDNSFGNVALLGLTAPNTVYYVKLYILTKGFDFKPLSSPS